MIATIRAVRAVVVSGLAAALLVALLLLFMSAPLVLFALAAVAGLGRWAWRVWWSR